MVARILVCLLFIGALAAAVPIEDQIENELSERVEEDAILQTPRLIRKYGYPAEVHHVTTEDGYILELHRIPYGIQSPAAPNKPVVLLQHGLFCSSSDWVIMGPEKGFAYILADLGYDVWLGNNRGNTYSRNHVTLDPDEKNGTFWDYSWHEMGFYDLPAEIDYILALVEQPNLFYSGHSEGTTQFYVMASTRPEYNAKIRAMFSLAPVAYMSNIPNPFMQYIAHNTSMDLEARFGVQEVLPHTELNVILGERLCRDGVATQVICENIFFLICGYDPDQLNSTMLPVIVGHTPAGASSKQLYHYNQEIISGIFAQYDHGEEKNMEVYGTPSPPDYDTSKITCPVALHYASNDWLAGIEDVDQLSTELPNLIGKFLVPFEKFNHLDFLWAIDVKELLYDQVTSLMADYL